MGKENIYNRLIAAGIIVTLLFTSITVRLLFIQVRMHERYRDLALKQRSIVIETNATRGNIFDRNLNLLTNNYTSPTIIIPKISLLKDEVLLKNVTDNTSLSTNEFKKILDSKELILEVPLKREFDISNYNNVFIVDKINRYDKENLLAHVIGYIKKSDNTGKSGLELSYNEFLEQSSRSSIFLEYDDKKTLIVGATEVDDPLPPMLPTSIVTTIDLEIQRIVESVMDKHRINGSVIVTEVESGDILAMASRPNIDQEHIYNHLDNKGRDLLNKSIQARYPPGSVFKIVVLLAALKEDPDILNKKFLCNGFETVYGQTTRCSAVHGELSLKEAFSKSCNSAFIQIGKELGSNKIIDMARYLNFGEKITIGLTEEIEGILPTYEQGLGPEIRNISIGQGKIEVTPLQITNLLMIIANDGIQKKLKLIEGISNDNGRIIKEYKVDDDRRIIEKEHASILKEYLIDVVENGTGSIMDLSKYGSAGGKTGSAEARLYNKDTIHGWFAGFYPAENPSYVITVLVEEGMSGSRSAAPIFEEICFKIFKKN